MTIPAGPPRIVAVVGPSGVGKTTIIETWAAHLHGQGLRVACFKHSHHPFPQEPQGKDSGRLASLPVLWSGWAADGGLSLRGELRWHELLEWLVDRSTLDLLLVEGSKSGPWPKIEVVRQGFTRPTDLDVLTTLGDEGLPWADPSAWTAWWRSLASV